ncbi:MAG: hypothetical protein Q9205_006151 [Flavoplaca limonia]
MDITEEVSIIMKQYVRFANPSGWKDIGEALNDFEQRFADTERPTDLPAYHARDTFSSGGVTLDIISQHFGPELLSGMEMARIIQMINRLFFFYKDNPRDSDFLNLDIEPPPSDSEVRLVAHDVGSIVHRIRSQLISKSGLVYGPREFGGLIKDETRQLAKIFLTVHDPEEGIAQE